MASEKPTVSFEQAAAAHLESLKKVRESKTLSLKPNPLLRQEIVNLDGSTSPLTLRYYQCQGIYHLLMCKRMVLGDGTGLGKCVSGSTLLVGKSGTQPIRSFAPVGFELANSKEGFYDLDRPLEVWTGRKMARVPRFYWGGKKPTLKITTRNLYQLEGTLVHPLMARTVEGESWTELRNLKVGDYLCVDRTEIPFPTEEPLIPTYVDNHPRAFKYCYPISLDPELATLLGYIVAEGNRIESGITVTQDFALNPEPHNEIRILFKSVFGWEGNYKLAARDVRVIVCSVGIKAYLAACGVGEELSREKFVPPCIMQGTRESVRGFLSAFIEGECSVEEDGGIEISSASEQLIREIQQLLLRFGVVGTLSPKRIKDNPHTYWRLNFFGDNARIFQDQIGLRSSRKADALRASLDKKANTNKDLVPHAIEEVRNLKLRILEATSRKGANSNRKGSGLKQYGESFQSTFKHILGGKRNPSYPWLIQLLEVSRDLGLENTPEYQAVHQIVSTRFFYDPIISIEAGEAEVMDIEVDDPDHSYIANGLRSHNTCQVLGALTYLWGKEREAKALIVCPKSAIRQWAAEVKKFTNGPQVFVAAGSWPERKKAYDAWYAAPTGPNDPPSILVTNYHSVVRDWDFGAGKGAAIGSEGNNESIQAGYLDAMTAKMPYIITVFDESTAFKNPATKTHQTCRFLSDRSKRCYGLTATLLKNNLMEGFGIYKVICPAVFTTKTAFMNDFCVTELQRIPGGAKIPIVVGYKNLVQFRSKIDPVFYGRAKHLVSNELPTLTTKEIVCELSPAEDRKYGEALSGMLELGDGETRDFTETKALTSLIYCQQVVDSLALLKFEEGSVVETDQVDLKVGLGSKEQALLDLINDEFDGEKIIIYTRFESLVGRLQAILTKNKIKSARITGKESDKKRAEGQAKFQDLNSDTKVIFITDAGSEAINLQAAVGIVFYDSPWSWGNYVQILGRMIRIGSPHHQVLAVHLVAERPNREGKKRETIDHATIKTLRKKKGVSDQVLGEAALGALTFERGQNAIKELMQEMRASSKP